MTNLGIKLSNEHDVWINSDQEFTLLINNDSYYFIRGIKIAQQCSNLLFIAETAIKKEIVALKDYVFHTQLNSGHVYKKNNFFVQSGSGDQWFPPQPVYQSWNRLNDQMASKICNTEYSNWIQEDSNYGNMTTHDDGWIKYIEDASNVCAASSGLSSYNITCTMNGSYKYYKFGAGRYLLTQQVWLPEYTIIEGNANPNDINNPRIRSDINSLTIFEPTHSTTESNPSECSLNVPTWMTLPEKNWATFKNLKCQRRGFLMNNNTVIRNFDGTGYYESGSATTQPPGDGGLAGGGFIELPGCASEYSGNKKGTCGLSITTYPGVTFPNNWFYTGNGKGVNNVLVENLRINDLRNDDPSFLLNSKVAFWSSMTIDDSSHTNITLRQIFCAKTLRDGMNIHGRVVNFLGEDLHFENPGDDVYAVWGVGDTTNPYCPNKANLGTDISFNHIYARIKRGPGICAQVFGAKHVLYNNLTCCDRRPQGWPHPCFRKLSSYCGDNSQVIKGYNTRVVVKPVRWYSSEKTTLCPSLCINSNPPIQYSGDFLPKCTSNKAPDNWGKCNRQYKNTWGLCPRSETSGCIYSVE
jgi:hypothetical protein